jgi:hypothetical protein
VEARDCRREHLPLTEQDPEDLGKNIDPPIPMLAESMIEQKRYIFCRRREQMENGT